VIPDPPVDPLPGPPIFIIEPRPMPMRLNVEQEAALAMWDAAPMPKILAKASGKNNIGPSDGKCPFPDKVKAQTLDIVNYFVYGALDGTIK